MYEIVVAIEDEESTKKFRVYKNMQLHKALQLNSIKAEPIKAQVYDYKEEILKMQSLLEQVQKNSLETKKSTIRFDYST